MSIEAQIIVHGFYAFVPKITMRVTIPKYNHFCLKQGIMHRIANFLFNFLNKDLF